VTSGIHKIYKLESVKFTALPNWVVRDPSYTPNTFRLLAYLLSHEDGYEITYGQIERQTGLGRYAINEASKYLVMTGWLDVSRPKGLDGRFAAKSWTLKNPTSVDDSTMEQPHMESFHYGTANALKENNSLEKTNTKRKQQQETLRSPFDEFWDNYPKKLDKGKAKRAFESALNRASAEQILEGVICYKADPNRIEEYTKYPATWLNADSWANGLLPHDSRIDKQRTQSEQDNLKKEWGNK
jgi:hypothetical protein